jgi:hypothetical protein
MQFRLLVDFEVIEILEALPKKSRTRLLNHFQKIRAAPGDFSDYYERDITGRRIEISVFANYAIHFWNDHADQHIKILALKSAD